MAKKLVSLPISAKERQKITHEINSVYHSRYEGKENCLIHNGNYTYYFVNYGFNEYDIRFKILIK